MAAVAWNLGVAFLCAGTLSFPADPVRQVANLHTARAAHTATALRSGQVLIAGGMTEGGGSLNSVELFDPVRNSVQPIGALREARVSHTATLLTDGRVLISGGYRGDYLRSLEVFDPATKRFQPAGSMVEARSGHTATRLADGRVLFTGGVGRGWTFLSSAELYDPTTGRSEAVSAMSAPRESHTATLLPDGRVVIMGGHSGRRDNMRVYASAEIFSPQTRRFTAGGDLGTPRHKHDAIMLQNGTVLVVGGADRTDRVHFATTEIYDPRTTMFTRGPTMANRRYKIAGTSILLATGDVLVTSGAPRAELYDVRHSRFREVAGGLPDAFRFATAARLANGDVVIIGGYSDRNRNTAGIWRFTK